MPYRPLSSAATGTGSGSAPTEMKNRVVQVGASNRESAPYVGESLIRINLLDVTVWRGGDLIQLGGRSSWHLTYSIALRDRPVARPTLIADIWPDIEDENAKNSFNLCLHRLRKRLGHDTICLNAHGYVLGSQVTTDLRALELFQKSLAGRSDVSDYEIGLVAAAHRRLGLAAIPTQIASTETGDLFTQKVEYLKHVFAQRLADFLLHSNQTEMAMEIAQEMIRLDCCDESAWEIVVRAHLARNNRGAAIRDYRTYARNLAHELGLQPSRRIAQLIAQCADEASPVAMVLRGAERTGTILCRSVTEEYA